MNFFTNSYHFYWLTFACLLGTLTTSIWSQHQTGCLTSQCADNHFQCKNCRCILKSWLCNHNNDCGDGSDEHANCTYPSCSGHEFTCKNQRCIDQKWVCDGGDDCTDGSDEVGCHKKSCPDWQWTCLDSEKCIPITKVCDGTKDCDDGSDEGSSCSVSRCSWLFCGHACQRTPSGGQCYCSTGMALDLSDNRTCIDFDECSSWGYCDQKCVNQPGSYKCSCYDGFTSKGDKYCAFNNSESMRLFVGTNKRIFSVNSTGGDIQVKMSNSVIDIEFSYTKNKIYYINNKYKILEANMDGSNSTELPIISLGIPSCLALDWKTNNLYFSDFFRRIGIYDLDTGYQRSIITDDINNAVSLAVDPNTGFLFFSESRINLRTIGRIVRAFMDGSHQVTLRLDKIIYPRYLTLDIVNQRLYWIDYLLDHIETVDYYGRFRHTIISGGVNIPAPVSLALFENQVFWADNTKMGVLKVNKYDGLSSVSQIFRNSEEEMTTIKVFHPLSQGQNYDNPCKNANCEQMCILTHTTENAGLGYKCLCEAGYELMENQINCTKIDKFLLLVCSYAVRGIPLTPSTSHAVDAIPPLLAQGSFLHDYVTADYTASDETIYFSEISDRVIYRAHLNGSGLQPLIIRNSDYMENFAIDWVSRNLYFTEYFDGSITVVRIDHPEDQRILITNVGRPKAICIHVDRGWIFYSDWFRSYHQNTYIARANTDGTNIVRIRRHEIGWPYSLTIDHDSNRLYWCDVYFDRIQHSDFDGNDVQTLNLHRTYHPFGIVIYKDSIYFVDWKRLSLHKVDKNGRGVTTVRSFSSYIMDVKIYDKELQTSSEQNPCARRNGDCSHFCFPVAVLHSASNPVLNSHCGCPYGKKLDINLRNCIPNPEETSKPTCAKDSFECDNKRCIHMNYRCNGEDDCFDNSDEANCTDRTCLPDSFQCKNFVCISRYWVCDNDFDCMDKSDEFNCTREECSATEFKCNNSLCLSHHFKCNTFNDCGDGSDEGSFCEDHTCATNYFLCKNKKCVIEQVVCDGDNDCYDNSDEEGCPQANCSNSEWMCQSHHQCINKEKRCDKKPDCRDGSDETGCPSQPPGVCDANEFKCVQGGCIPAAWKCDGHEDCEDASDEKPTCPPPSCPGDLFRCNNGFCIHKNWVCDGMNDCVDNSDEDKALTCPPPPFTCPYGHWECPLKTRICIPDAKVCDGNPDCPEGHDESPLCNTDTCQVNNGGCSDICLQTPLGAQCQCPEGEELNGTKICMDKNECEPPGHCSQKCLNTIGSFKCYCEDGYQLLSDRRTCRILRNETLPIIIGVSMNSVNHFFVDSKIVMPFYVYGWRYLGHVALHHANSSLYVVDSTNKQILQMTLSGTNLKQVITTGIGRVGGLAVDWIGHNLYWTDSQLNTVQVASLDGENRMILFMENNTRPSNIVLDPREGSRFLFWSNWVHNPHITRAGMDGTNRTVIVSEKIGRIKGIAIDYPNKYLYFVSSIMEFIDFCDYDGKNRHRVLSSDSLLRNPHGIVVLEDSVYWCEGWKLFQCNKFNCSHSNLGSVLFRTAIDIASYSKVSQPSSSNPCFQTSCSHLCLLSPKDPGYKCACPISMQLSNDGKNCVKFQPEFLLYIGRNHISPLQLNKNDFISFNLVGNYLDIDYDTKEGYLYYIKSVLKRIRVKKVEFFGTTSVDVWPTVFFTPPIAFAIDWVSRNLFWISTKPPAIEVLKLDGDVPYHRKLLGNNDQPTGVFKPNSICVDPIIGSVYWIDLGGGYVPKKIAEIKMDGTGSRILIREHLNEPGYLTKDPTASILYWSESYFGKIERYDIPRKHREVVLENLAKPKGLAIYKGFLYYTQADAQAISKISLTSLENGGVIIKKEIPQLQGLKLVYARYLLNETNSCAGNNYGGCSQLCLPNGLNSHSCECSTGLSKNAQGTCTAGSSFLVVVTKKRVQGFSLQSDDHPDAMVPLAISTRGTYVAPYPKENYIYISSRQKCSKFRPDGTQLDTINYDSSTHFSLAGMAVDWVAGNLYLKSIGLKTEIIEVGRLNGTNRLVILEDLRFVFYSICVNPIKRYIYWTGIGISPKLERANLDGSNRTVLVRNGIKRPLSITIDILTHDVYWVDSLIDALQRISYSGGNRQYVRSNLVTPVGVAVFGNNVYWADSAMLKIFSVPKNSKVGAPSVVKSQFLSLIEIAVYDAAIQPAASNPCSENNGGCEQLCFSFPNNSTAVCKCATGQLGPDGCKCIPPTEFLIFAHSSEIRSVFLDPNVRSQPFPVIKSEKFVLMLDYDYRENYIYFTQSFSGKLSRVKKGSTVVEDIVYVSNNTNSRFENRNRRQYPVGIAVDWVSKKLYWTDHVNSKILAMNPDFNHKVTLIHTSYPLAIALNPCKGYMYWTSRGKIERATMAGNQRTAIITSGLVNPTGLTIDYEDEKIFWADHFLNKIERSNLEGNYREVIIDIGVVPYYLTVFNNHIYWSDGIQSGIMRAEKHTGHNKKILIDHLRNRPFDLKVFSEKQQTCNNDPCEIYNGGCSHGCHPAPDGKAECSCDDNSNLVLANDQKMCVPEGNNCTSAHFICMNGKCIYKRWICDMDDDCGDNSDENPNLCADHTCEPSMFRCDNGRCIRPYFRCDYDNDCRDNSDERDCDHPTCGPNEFECKNFRCIGQHRVCDGYDHCQDGFQTDEQNCPNNITCMTGLVKCPNNNICLFSRFLCDGDNDCGDNSDENAMFCQSATCAPGAFYCSNRHRCIPGAWHCDGDDDCGDMEDEPASCNSENRTCYDNLFSCDNGNCIAQHWVCDGNNDCLDGSDEAEALKCSERTCPPTFFTCKSNLQIGTSPCISQHFVCDGEKNCVAGEDEMQSCPARTCSEDQFVCDNGFCIMSPFYCDHDNDCGDNSDEPTTCEYPSCSDDQFTCDNQRCVPQVWVCDTDNDCLDHSDEKASMCFTPAPTCPPGEFLCKNGECINYSVVCNKQPDCSDSSDEEHCYINECENTETNQCQHKCVDTITSFHCECHSGFALMNDKKACRDINECQETPEVCSQHCLNTVGNYTCKCNDGYQKENKHHCKRKDHITPWLVFSNRYYIRELSTDGQIYRRVAQDFESIVTLDFDYAEQRLYYIDYVHHNIQRMFLNGSNRETIVSVPHGEGIAVDWVGRKLYWVDFFFARMYVSELNGTSRATLLTRSTRTQKGLSRPRAIVVNPSSGYLYWTDWGANPCIGRIGMDGSNYTRLITEKIEWPNGLTIDYETNRLWWADAHFDYIEYANADGTNRHVVIQGDLPHPYAITIFEDWIYWTELSQSSIEKANKYTGANRVVMKNTTHHSFDICVIHPLRQKPHPNPCGSDNGGCSHLCLLAPENKYRCLCPDNFFLNSDNRTCIANCSSAQFRCGITDDRCIPLIWKCDGEEDCKDGIDEPDDCPHSECPPGQFQCKNSNCTFSFAVCDQHDDCGDGSDEENCDKRPCPPWQWKCQNNKCILHSWQCDGEDDCGDGSDELPEKCVNQTCSPSQFTCANGACILKWWKCDFDHDCLDGSDESPDLNCANQTCREGWFKCASNYRCIPQSYVCDGRDDCRDNSDEVSENCPSCSAGQYQCDNNRCIPTRWLCDFENDCYDGSDEKQSVCKDKYRSCSESEFQCKNKKCIQNKWRCDYDNDCGDGSDEENCGKITCPEDNFRCNEGFCVHQSVTCDGRRDCKDVSDELNCTARYPNGKFCPSDVFECKNTICIPLKWRCDGADDCGDGSDEVVSVCKDVDCPPNTHFRCNNFKCIPRWRLCNKVDDCGDASDENNPKLCQPVRHRCEGNQFKCANKQCIDSSKVCDDFLDCEDSSDEQGCHKTTGTVNCTVNNGGCAHNCTDLKQGGFYCSCRKGYKVSTTNRKECEDVNECDQWGNHCPQVCNNLKGSYKCICLMGFVQIPYPVARCKAVSGEMPSVFFTMGSEVRQFVHNAKYKQLFSSHRPQALAGNPRHFTLYWTDSVLKSIYWVYIAHNTGPVIKLPISGLQEPNGIAVDWISGNIYWTDTAKRTISVAAYDGKYSYTLIRNGLRKPYAIITNSNTGWMYWTDIDSERPTIERAWMNGENREVLVSERLIYPTGITIDYFMGHRVFWCDAKLNVIESMKADGSDRVIVIQKGLQNPISLDVFEEFVYWLSETDGKLIGMDKFGRGVNITFQSGLVLPKNLKVFHTMKINQDVKSKCNEKSTCSHLCLLTPDTHKCACPDNSKLFAGSSTVCNAAAETSIELSHCNCQNGGTCIQVNDNKYTCKCKEGFYGLDCTSLTPEKRIGELEYTKVTAVAVPVVLLLIIAAVSVGGFFFMKRRGKFFLNKPIIGAPSVPHTPLGVVSYRDGENVNIGTPPLSYDIITSGQEINPLENEYSSSNPACPTNFSNPMYGVDHPSKMEQQPTKKAPSLPTSSLETIESKTGDKPTDSQKKTSEAKPKNENYYVSLKTGKSFDPMEDTDKETASLVKIGEL